MVVTVKNISEVFGKDVFTNRGVFCGRVADIEVNLLKKVRIEVAVNEDFVQPTIDGIIQGAKTGKIGDGKIFIQELSECIRIRTEEKGNKAIG